MESDGPYYDEMTPGMVFSSPPAVSVDSGVAASYQSIAGEALPLVLDQRLCNAVTGASSRLVSPGLLLHLSIGASTVATKNVIANLFYRNVRILRQVFIGETIETITTVASMSDSAPREGKEPRGKVLLNITTTAILICPTDDSAIKRLTSSDCEQLTAMTTLPHTPIDTRIPRPRAEEDKEENKIKP